MRNMIFVLITFAHLYSQCWVATYDGPANDYDVATGIVRTSDGSIYVTGDSKGIDCEEDYCTIKYNSSGTEQWIRRYDGQGGMDCAKAIAADNTGNIYVTGRACFPETGTDIVTIKYNSDGELIWLARYSSPGPVQDIGNDVICDNNGNVYVTGDCGNIPQKYPITIKYDSNGVQSWAVIDTIRGVAYRLGLDREQNIYVAGLQIACDSNRYSIIKYNSDGVEQWRAGYNIIGYAIKLKVTSDGDVCVTGPGGLLYFASWRFDIVTAKYNSLGQEQWVQRYDGPAQGWDEGVSLAIDNQENVYVGGVTAIWPGNMPAFDWITIKYSPSGSEEWIRTYGFDGDDVLYDIAVDDQNNGVYVSGWSFKLYPGDQWNADATIVKYDFSGNLLWEARWNDSGRWGGGLYCLTIDEQGYIYAAGFGWDNSIDIYDYLTIKYPPSGPGISEELCGNVPPKPVQITIQPNPAINITAIRYTLPRAGPVSIKLYDITGAIRLSRTINNPTKDGVFLIDAKALPSGVYILRFNAGDTGITRKLVIEK